MKSYLISEFGKKEGSHCDTAGFKDMKKLEFLRTVTLAEDGVPCDYCFMKCKQPRS